MRHFHFSWGRAREAPGDSEKPGHRGQSLQDLTEPLASHGSCQTTELKAETHGPMCLSHGGRASPPVPLPGTDVEAQGSPAEQARTCVAAGWTPGPARCVKEHECACRNSYRVAAAFTRPATRGD